MGILEVIAIAVLVILVPLAMLALGASQFARGMEKIDKSKRDKQARKIQKDFYKAHPGATQQDFIRWYVNQVNGGPTSRPSAPEPTVTEMEEARFYKTPTVSARFCTRCGHQAVAGDAFCTACGRPM